MTAKHSFAGENRGTADPETVEIVNEDDEEVEPRHKSPESGIFVVMWSGNGYSRANSWISADKTDVIDLSEHR